MAWFALRPRSLADKLTMLTVYSSGIVLALACAAFVVNDIALMRSWKAQEMRETVEMLAAASAEPLEHANPRALRDLLMFQNHREQIYSVHVFDNAGDLFAKFERDEAQGPPPTRPSFIGHQFNSSGVLDVCLPVRTATEEVGSIHLRATVGDLTNQITRYISIAAGVALVAFLLAILVCRQLQRTISVPILGLVQTIRRITDAGDFSLRVRRPSNDEIGDLYDEVNELLRRIGRFETTTPRATKNIRWASDQSGGTVPPQADELSQDRQRIPAAS
jgi:methyl-accepting chemotaxis protein